MQNLWKTAICVAALLASQGADAASPARVYSPSMPWNVDYADDSCALRREFTSGEDRALLELRQFSPSDVFSATAASTAFKQGSRPLKVRLLPDQTSHVASGSSSLQYPNGLFGFSWLGRFALVGKEEEKLTVIGAIPDRTTREKGIEGIELSAGLTRTVILATGEMYRPMQAMRKCMDELLTHWGIDAVAHRTLSSPVKARDQQQWAKIIQENYPGKMLTKEMNGIVRVRLMVGTDGLPISCHIQVPSQDKSFETTACAGLMSAARFEPALDAVGKPIASYFATSIFYTVN